MICPYMPCNHVTKLLKDPDNDRVLYETKSYQPINCLKDKCPFYSDGNGEYRESVCIKAAREMEE